MNFEDKLGRIIKVGDYIARPTKYGGSRVNELAIVVKINPKSIKIHQVNQESPEGRIFNGYNMGVSNISNYGECIIINKEIKDWFN